MNKSSFSARIIPPPFLQSIPLFRAGLTKGSLKRKIYGSEMVGCKLSHARSILPGYSSSFAMTLQVCPECQTQSWCLIIFPNTLFIGEDSRAYLRCRWFRCLAEVFAYARDVACCDFAAVSNHDHFVEPIISGAYRTLGGLIRNGTNQWNEPNRFVTLQACEYREVFEHKFDWRYGGLFREAMIFLSSGDKKTPIEPRSLVCH